MPLEHSSSDAARNRNIHALMGEIGKSPHVQSKAQAIAIGYETQRRAGRASGGVVPGYDDGGAVQQVLSALQAGASQSNMGNQGIGGTNPAAPSSPQATAATNGLAPPAGAPNMATPSTAATTANPAVTPPAAPMPVGIAQNTVTTPTGMPPAGVNPTGVPAVNNPIARPLMNTGGALHRAEGGFSMNKGPHLSAGWQTRAESRNLMHGPILSNVPGRTDNHRTRVPSGAYVLPSATISSLGQGNSVAGLSVAHKMFGTGPFGMPAPKMGHGHGPPTAKPPAAFKFMDGGYSEGGARGEGDDGGVDVLLSGGEFVVHPEVVRKIGKGSLENGHKILDAFVMHNRKKEINTLKTLPEPAKK